LLGLRRYATLIRSLVLLKGDTAVLEAAED
jgi:hypothetical protein